MAAKKCPICGETALEKVQGDFRFKPPPNVPGGTIVIPKATWRRCSACGESIIPHKLDQALDRERARRLRSPAPERILRVRARTGLS